MPATAGRVRMPANNRVHSSAALQTHGIWQSAIGYDPYAPNQNNSKQSAEQSGPKASNSEPEGENAYASFQGLLALARLTGSNADEARGACKKCGRVGHLTFQCRNFLSVKEDIVLQTLASAMDKSKVNGKEKPGFLSGSEESSEEDDDDESETSDSNADSEIERIIAARSGSGSVKNKTQGGKESKSRSSSKKHASKHNHSDSDNDRPGSRDGSHKRSKKKRSSRRERDGSSASEDFNRKRRKEMRRRKHRCSAEDDSDRHRRKNRKEKKRKRGHRYSDFESTSEDSEEAGGHRRKRVPFDSRIDLEKKQDRRKSRRQSPLSDFSESESDDSGRGRSGKRSDKRSLKHRRREEMH